MSLRLSVSPSSRREEAALSVMIHYTDVRILKPSATTHQTTRARKLSVIVSQMHQVVVSPGML